jgi:pyruvate dehydrogenase E2 component (dihydrolipoyllysine-residue acetyltransferase)
MSVTSVILPKLGLTMDEGMVVAWLKNEGDRVEAGEILFEVETDKATMEVESPVAGYVRKLLAAAGETVPVTRVIALISTTADEPLVVPPGQIAPEQSVSVEASAPPVASRPEDGRIVASPAARKRAQVLGVDLARVRPAKGGRISVEDVEASAPPPGRLVAAPVAPLDTPVAAVRAPLSRMRRAIAERMTQSFRDVPQFSVSCDVDMVAANAARTAAGVSYEDVLIWAAARTLHDHPRLAMRYDAEGLIPAIGIHLGVAVALDDGLLVPVLRDADTKDLTSISRDRKALQEGARTGKLPVDALIGAVFTVSNLGQHGVDRFTAIVNPPEAAILAVGRVRDMVVARGGVVVVAPVLTLTLSVDHRVADGTEAAAFLSDLAGRLTSGMP